MCSQALSVRKDPKRVRCSQVADPSASLRMTGTWRMTLAGGAANRRRILRFALGSDAEVAVFDFVVLAQGIGGGFEDYLAFVEDVAAVGYG